MRKIFPLPQQIISKIAAGEVIERPVYAVKELIENSLDAEANSIAIAIEDGGLKLISVIDNGEGMSEEDLRECFKLHTTSKISSAEQLTEIKTLGFRGEALSSIAAVSKMTIQSKTRDAVAGTKIEIVDGKIKKISPAGMPVGTGISVGNLFHTIPGRKKFLKSTRTEFRHIAALVSQYALSYPEVHFFLSHNGKKILDLPKANSSYSSSGATAESRSLAGASDQVLDSLPLARTINTGVLNRIRLLFGDNFFSNILPLIYEDNYISISGFLTTPQHAASTSQKQFIFVNNRSITDKHISSAVKDAYGTLLESAAYPVFILFFSIPHFLIDVNVHPRKEQVRFADQDSVYKAVYKAISETLIKHNLLYFSDNLQGIGLSDGDSSTRKSGYTNSYAGTLLKESRFPWDLRDSNQITANRELVQLHNLYLITQTKHGILFIDQHAAHERILYEQFFEEFTSRKRETARHHLTKPQVIEFSIIEKELLEEHQDIFLKMGFAIEHFKDNTFIINAVPVLFQDRKYGSLIMEMLEDIRQEKHPKEVDKISQRMIAYLACRGAVKAGDRLTKKQAKELVEKLEQTNNNATCPHGRPTRIIVAIERIDRMFKRK